MANRITTVFDFSERGQGLKKIKADMAEVDGSIAKAKVGIKGLWSEFSNNRMAQAAVAGLVAKVGTDAVIAASNLEESINAVNVTYGESADEIHKLGEVSAETWGLSQRAFNEFSVQFSSFAQNVANRDGRAVSDVVSEMTTRVADFASVMNLDVSEAARVFQSALAGETEPIKKFGIDMSAAAVEAYALENGLAASKKEMTESVKVAARYGLLMESTAKTAGDFKNTQDGMANSTRTLQAQFEDLQATLGRQLLPAVADTTSTLVDMAHVAGQLGDQLEALGDKVPDGPIGEFIKMMGPLGLVEATVKKPLQGISWALDKVGISSEDAAFSIEKAEEAYYQQAYAAGRLAPKIDEASEAFERNARQLRENAEESTYNADAHDEMGRIQRITTGIVDDARRAQERYLDSIKHVRDEVGALRREIDDRQAWLALQDTFDATTEKLKDQEATVREQEQAMLDLKEEVLDYAESINLPDKVTTQLIADIDAGKVSDVEALLERWGNGITVPIKPQVIKTGTGTSVRITPEGNVVPGRARGGPVSSGQTYLVGEEGPELLHMGNQSGSITPNDKIGVGGSITVNIMGGYVDDRTISELERRLDQWRRGAR